MHDENITQSSMPDGKYVGVISDIKATKRSKRYCINVKVNIWENDSLQTYIKSFRTIFGLGRIKFQEFCEDFTLYDKDNRLDLSKALGKVCIAEFDLHNGFNKIKPARQKDVERIDFKSAFGNLEIADDVGDMPELIENYYFFDYDEDAYEDDVEYYGIVRSWRGYPGKNNQNDIDVCIKIAVLNGCELEDFCYFINNINYIGEHDLQMFEDIFDIESKYEIDLDEAIGELCKVTLYTANTGKTYIRSVDYFMCEDYYKEKQYKLWAQDYARLMKMSAEEFAICDF